MKSQIDFEYRFFLEFPTAKYYAGSDVLQIMANAIYCSNLSDRRSEKPKPFYSGKWTTDNVSPATDGVTSDKQREKSESNFSEAEHNAHLAHQNEAIRGLQFYLSDRLLKAVINGKFELWDASNTTVSPPPREPKTQHTEVHDPSRTLLSGDAMVDILDETTLLVQDVEQNANSLFRPAINPVHLPLDSSRTIAAYKTAYWWATMSTISKSDLVRFCKDERIKAWFEGEESAINVVEEEQAMGVKPNEQCTAQIGIPGKRPRVAIGKLAVEIAWENECATGRRVTAKEVIATLQHWVAERRSGSNILKKSIPNGVEWITVKGDVRKYGVDACAKTLETWNSSRA
ncbi:hypothetical protein [Rhodoferax ferrireducens]|uniref:hypothetical protein n=1 Tax=Rhodoferax ferrireducens TaxID=192843 RepID=UPI001300343C|nr:hypothetical protein [Rhodoferax ferrireducens]